MFTAKLPTKAPITINRQFVAILVVRRQCGWSSDSEAAAASSAVGSIWKKMITNDSAGNEIKMAR